MLKKIILVFFICLNIAGASQTTFSIIDMASADSLSHVAQIMLADEWEYKKVGEEQWHSIHLPASLSLLGQFSFRKYFALDSLHTGDVYCLQFLGVDGNAQVWLNKKKIAANVMDTAPFFLDLTHEDVFANERNELLVEIDTRKDYSSSLPLMVRERGLPIIGSALFRPVILYSAKRPFINSFKLTTDLSGATLALQVSAISSDSAHPAIVSSAAGLLCSIDIFEPASEKPAFSSTLPVINQEVIFALNFPFKEWSVAVPIRYKIQIMLLQGKSIVQRVNVQTAIKSETQQGNWQGRLKLIEWVEDIKTRQLAGAVLDSKIESDIKDIAELGANGIRVFGNAPDPFLLKMCDKYGLFAFLEIPVVNIPSNRLNSPLIRKSAEQDLKKLISAFQNYACVLAWGLGSGYDANAPDTNDFISSLAQTARKLDNRPLYAGFRGSHKYKKIQAIDWQIVELSPEECRSLQTERLPDSGNLIYRVICPMQNTAEAAEQAQAFELKNLISNLYLAHHSSHIIFTPLQDWLGNTPHSIWGPRQNANLFLGGLLSGTHEKRLSYQVAKAAFSGKPLPEILPADENATDPVIFQIVGFALLIILLLFIKRDKRLAYYLRRAFIYPHGFYMDLNENRQVSKFLTHLIGLSSFLIMALVATSLLYYLRSSSWVDEWLTWLFPTPRLKYQALWLIWNPAILLLFITVALFVLAVVQSLFYKIIILSQQRFLKFSQLMSFVLWVPANFLFALPLAIILYRALDRTSMVNPSLLYLVAILIWFFIRSTRGIKVMLQYSTFKALLFQLLEIAVILFVFILYFQQSKSIVAYANYYWSLMGF